MPEEMSLPILAQAKLLVARTLEQPFYSLSEANVALLHKVQELVQTYNLSTITSWCEKAGLERLELSQLLGSLYFYERQHQGKQ
jgi:hypothetical protein